MDFYILKERYLHFNTCTKLIKTVNLYNDKFYTVVISDCGKVIKISINQSYVEVLRLKYKVKNR